MSPWQSRRRSGFTLVELLVVVLIIGILAAIALPRFLGQRTRAKNAAAQSAVRHALVAARSYYTQNSETYSGLGPAQLQGYESSLSGTEAADGQQPGASGANPQDIWIGNGAGSSNPSSGDANSGNTVVLCSVSRGDTVYCVKDVSGVASYLAATGSSVVAAAAGSYSASGWSTSQGPPVTLTLSIATGSDDAFRRLTTSSFTLSGSSGGVDNTAGRYDATYYRYGAGLRFTNVSVPRGATITAATLTLRSITATDMSYGQTTARTRLRAQQADNPATFSTQADFDARIGTGNDLANGVDASKIGTSVDWDTIATGLANDTSMVSPDLSVVIQELVGRSGWNSGNALVLFWDDFDNRSPSTGGIRFGYDYERSPSKAPSLSITYRS